jgi:hypothetical protein
MRHDPGKPFADEAVTNATLATSTIDGSAALRGRQTEGNGPPLSFVAGAQKMVRRHKQIGDRML